MNAPRLLFSQEAEQSVIGAVLLSNDAYEVAADVIGERDFWYQVHRVIWRHIVSMVAAGRQVDVVTLVASIEAANEADIVEVSYLGEILQGTPTAANVRHYANVVRDRSLERQLASAANEMMELSSGDGPVADRLDTAQRLIFSLAESNADGEPREAREVLHSFIEVLEKRMELDGALSGLETGLKDLDEKLDGLQAGDLVIIAGRPSMGKTALAAEIGDNAAMAGKSVLAFSLEMSAEQWAQRSVSRIGRVNSHALRSGKLNSEELERVSAAVGRLHDKRLVIDDRPGMPIERMRARARRVKRKQGGLDLVVVDYLQLMSGDGDNSNERVSNITRGLKLMARELGCPVVALSQLSRECEKRPNKRPMMSDLRDSGAIEQDADVIVFVYRDEVYHPDSEDRGTAELIIAKNRMGEIGMVRTAWIGEYTTFENWTGAHESQQYARGKVTKVQEW